MLYLWKSHGGLLAEHVPQAHCRATRHTDLESWDEVGPRNLGGCMAAVDSWSWNRMKKNHRKTHPIWEVNQVELYPVSQDFLKHVPYDGLTMWLVINPFWVTRWNSSFSIVRDVDDWMLIRKFNPQKTRVQGLLLQAEINNLKKPLQYLSWGLQLALDVGLPDHRV
jgi:hypothetical protein